MIISAKEQAAWDAACAAALGGIVANAESGCNTPRDLADWAAKCADQVILLRRERQGR